ncbi:MAG: hypothetical protein ABIH46_10755 [Chloroflexota bacterium]
MYIREFKDNGPRFLSLVPAENCEFVRAAAAETGFAITAISEPLDKLGRTGYASVYSADPRSRDTGVFWEAYHRLVEGDTG